MAAYYTDTFVARIKSDLCLHKDGHFFVTDKVIFGHNSMRVHIVVLF